MNNGNNHEDRRIEEGKDFTLMLEHTMDMNENPIQLPLPVAAKTEI